MNKYIHAAQITWFNDKFQKKKKNQKKKRKCKWLSTWTGPIKKKLHGLNHCGPYLNETI